jgi:electron transfer flavoprotein alpha subunit
MAALVLAEHDNQTLKAATFNTVTAALACSPEVDILVAGSNANGVAAAAAGRLLCCFMTRGENMM